MQKALATVSRRTDLLATYDRATADTQEQSDVYVSQYTFLCTSANDILVLVPFTVNLPSSYTLTDLLNKPLLQH